MTDYKEKIEIYTKYLEKKSNLVGSKYLRLHRLISHVELSIFQGWICDFATWRWFRNLEMICNLFHSLGVEFQLHSQLGGDFATWFAGAKMEAWAAKWHSCAKCGFRICEIPCEILQVDFISQLRNGLWAAKFLHSLMWLSSNGHNFFVSTPICTPFEAFDSWLPELRNDI